MIGRCRRCRGEEGVFLILWVLLLTALLTMVAIVIDLGALRSDRRIDRAAADAAATAGANDLPLGMTAACNAAWEYALVNLNLDPAAYSSTAPACGSVPPTCDPAVRNLWLGLAGPYTVRIVRPVPNLDVLLGADAVGGDIPQAANAAADGQPCDRIGVEISYTRSSTFGRVVGINQNTTTVHSVASAGQGTLGEPVALVVLDQTGCEALFASGQAAVIVEATVSAAGEQKPGIIALDSDASASSGCNGRYVLEVVNNANAFVRADGTLSGLPGIIGSFAMSGPNASKAYDPADLSSRLSPIPTPRSRRVTRDPIDHRYNCKVSNGCPKPTNPYIDQLVAALNGSGGTPPSGYRIYPDELVTPPPLSGETAQPDAACSMSSSAAAINVPAGNWFVNCNGGLDVSNTLTFLGGNVVTRSGVSVGAQGILTINAAGITPGNNGVLFLRSGDLDKGGQGSLIMRSTTAYVRNGNIDLAAGSGELTWVAPATGNLEDLALWSESTITHSVGGQASLDLEGVLFVPKAQFDFTGQPGVNQTNAQFVAKRLEVKGQGTLRMRPDPERVVLIPMRGVRLIR